MENKISADTDLRKLTESQLRSSIHNGDITQAEIMILAESLYIKQSQKVKMLISQGLRDKIKASQLLKEMDRLTSQLSDILYTLEDNSVCFDELENMSAIYIADEFIEAEYSYDDEDYNEDYDEDYDEDESPFSEIRLKENALVDILECLISCSDGSITLSDVVAQS